ncbi:related to monooxigenase [Phialocephala subalpina]|uniref:Related to monooxigenase n=1 Tax=Phialocephala subalpina TaxID=576137 RepID=A0A1L7WXJ0_9HELO|nr:related to monooxigenase [Phialocephala subalpina]
MAPSVINTHEEREESFLKSQPKQAIYLEPIRYRRPLRVVCLGAGYSGLMMGIVHNERMKQKNIDFTIYERNKDPGGCQCDIPAHNYAYSFEPNADWPNYYATSKQIHEYMCTVTKKYHVGKYMKFSHEIKKATWDEAAGKWKLIVKHGGRTFEDDCDIFINAGGVLNNWKYPNIEGIDDFKGKLLHSAHWDESYDFKGKRVAVIGIGSSGIQIVPQLAPLASHLTSFVRSQCWVSPAPGINEPTPNDPTMDKSYNYAPEVLERFRSDPAYLQEHRQQLADRRIQNFMRSWAGTDLQQQAQALFAKTMKQRLGDSPKGKQLADILIPSFPVGCRRQTPGPGFLETLMRDNVDLRWDDISKITEKGILTKSGEELEFDAIVCATGFDTSFRPSFPVVGRNDVDLTKKWDDGAPEAYFGIAIPDFPNYFTFIGPNSPISNGSLVQGIQITGIYIYNCIDKLQTEGIKSMEIDHGATEEYNEHTQEYLKRTVWVSHCRSWYKRGTTDGQVVAIYAGTSFHFIEALRKPRWEDYRLEYLPCGKNGRSRNRFAYLGDGFTVKERRNGTVGET